MANQSSTKKESKLKGCLKAPFRILIKARDCYVKAMMSCAGKFGEPSVGGTNGGSGLPKSYSTTSSVRSGDDEYMRDLIRAASTKSLKDKLELEMLRAEVMGHRAARGSDGVVPRSQSVAAIGRIDENAPCDFGDDVKVNLDFVPRSRSHAIPKNRARFM